MTKSKQYPNIIWRIQKKKEDNYNAQERKKTNKDEEKNEALTEDFKILSII